jgi:hypothetical protein
VVLSMVALLAMLALTVDGGYAYSQRRRAQNAADAAALAGARVCALGGNDTQVDSAVNQYATANGASAVSWYYLNSQQTVHVDTSLTFATFFASIVGLPQMTAVASAEASVQYISEADCLLPIIARVREFAVGQSYTLWADDPEAPGNFGWVDWNGGSPDTGELAANIADPCNSGTWDIAAWVPGCPGVVASSLVRDALSGWTDLHVTIPFYDIVDDGGSNTIYHISAFGEFVLEGHQLTGENKTITGHFIHWVEPGQGGGSDAGLKTIRLTE